MSTTLPRGAPIRWLHPARLLQRLLPLVWWNPDKFIGPAGLLQGWRFITDSRDTASSERIRIAMVRDSS